VVKIGERKMSAKKKSAKAARPNAYKEHIEGSRKGRVHELFDKQDQEAAWVLGQKLGLKQATLRSWFGRWKRDAETTKHAPKAKKPVSKKKSANSDKAAAPES
jgi:hypothetical protein